jgi:hypothetical protein
MVVFGSVFYLILIVVYLVLWITALVGILKAKNENAWKTNWLLVVILIPLIGLIIWWFLGLEELKKQ